MGDPSVQQGNQAPHCSDVRWRSDGQPRMEEPSISRLQAHSHYKTRQYMIIRQTMVRDAQTSKHAPRARACVRLVVCALLCLTCALFLCLLSGGGLYTEDVGAVSVTWSNFTSNVALQAGGGAYYLKAPNTVRYTNTKHNNEPARALSCSTYPCMCLMSFLCLVVCCSSC